MLLRHSRNGRILRTVNPRLFPEQIAYIINHAENRTLLFDLCCLPLVESITPQLKTIEKFIVLADRASLPDSAPRPLLCYEDLIDGASEDFQWPIFDECTAASLCYTSGTTGHPKGVLYSHRSTVLHALSTLQPDCFGLRAVDVVLPFVPMFHVHAWSTPYGCPMTGAKRVLPGHQLDARRSGRPWREANERESLSFLRRNFATPIGNWPTWANFPPRKIRRAKAA